MKHVIILIILVRELDIKHSQNLEEIEMNVRRVLLKKDGDIKKLKDEIQVKEMACEKLNELLKR
jgi:5-azacytidine-induced protein 1